MTLDLLHEFANTEVLCLFHNCMRQSWLTLKSVSISSSCVNKPRDCPLTSLSTLSWSASTFSSASSSLSKTFHRRWHTIFCSSHRSWGCASAAKQDIFYDFLDKQTRWLLTHKSLRASKLGFWILAGCVGNLHYFQQLLNPILASNHVSKKIFGCGRGDASTFSYTSSLVSIMIAFGIQQAGSVS